jgi:hypothetical protein
MRCTSRWMMAILAVLGLQTVAAQAKSLLTPHHANVLDLAPLNQNGGTQSDGSPIP